MKNGNILKLLGIVTFILLTAVSEEMLVSSHPTETFSENQLESLQEPGSTMDDSENTKDRLDTNNIRSKRQCKSVGHVQPKETCVSCNGCPSKKCYRSGSGCC